MRIIAPAVPGVKWLKASVIASFWAASEIILGSFLHNLRFPLSGTILSFASVMLVVSFIAGWKQRGIIWRAGLICALLKSISPSAIILGPMIGILTEALLLELATVILGHHLFGYAVGGAMAVFSTLLHKVVSLLILYGFDLVLILQALYKFALKQLGGIVLPAENLLWIISIIYILAGISASFAGFWVAKLSKKRWQTEGSRGILRLENEKTFISRAGSQKYSVWLLGFNVAMLVILLTLSNFQYFLIASVMAFFYIGFILFHYRHSLRYLKKPLFWIQFVAITMVASLLLDSIAGGAIFSVKGLMVGLQMNFRALVIILAFSAISTELRNPVIRAVSFRSGLSSLYLSVNLTFSALPAVLNEFPGVKTFIRHPLNTLADLIPVSERLISSFESSLSGRKPVIIISGERQQGKTSYLMSLVNRLSQHNIQLAGFFAKGVHEGGQRVGFDLHDIASSRSIPLCRLESGADKDPFRRFRFFEEALVEGKEILKAQNSELLIIDEVGPFELNNEGWATSIQEICQTRRSIQIWTVRKQLVGKVAATWPVGEVYVLNIDEDDIDFAVSLLEELVMKYRDRN